VSGASLRFGFPTSEYGSVQMRYTFRLNKITASSSASSSLQQEISANGNNTITSLVGATFGYNTLDDYMRPTKGVMFSLSEDFAGFAVGMKYLKTEASFTTYKPLMWDMVGQLTLGSGFIQAYGGNTVPIAERFFRGGDSFRGFKLAGVGPRDTSQSGDYGSLGGDFYAGGSAQARLPDILPADYGMQFALFTDFGTLGHLDTPYRGRNYNNGSVKDNLAIRASAGISVKWKSPFGPVQIDLGIPIAKTSYDKTQFIHFSAGTGM
jgi:outer membrane protein insertion porin family